MNVIMIGSHLKVTGITRVVKNYMQAGLKEKQIWNISQLIMAAIIS